MQRQTNGREQLEKLQSLLQCKEKTDQQVADELFQSTGVKRSRSAIQKYRMLKLKKMPSMGRPTFLPHTAAYKIINAIKLMRANKVPVYSMHVAMLAKRLAAQLGLEEKISFGRMEQRQQQREEVAVAAEGIDARNILVLSSDSASDSEGEGVSGRKKRRDNSSQYALLGPIRFTFGAALEKRKALEAAREQQQQQQIEQRAIRDQEVRAAQDKLREAGRAMDYKLTNDALRWDVAALTKSEYVALLFYLGKSLGEGGDVRCALLQFVATQPSLSHSARAQAALVAIQEPAAHPASAAAVANVIQ